MPDPTFSICIPNYNYGHYIGETIQSVLDQSYPNFELVVADNASTDNSVEVVQSFADPRIRLVQNRYNIGFAPNLQRATMFARNEFVNLLSSDDRMKPEALATYAEIIAGQGKRAGRTVLFSDVELIDAESNVIAVRAKDENFCTRTFTDAAAVYRQEDADTVTYQGRDILRRTLRQLRTFAPFLTIVYPREMWLEVEGYNSVRTVGPDKHFNYKLLSLDPDVIHVRRPLYQYRTHGSLNVRSLQVTLKRQIDDYLYTLDLPDALLSDLGLTRRDLIETLVNDTCLKTGLTEVAHGSYTFGLRMLAFAVAAYPGATLRTRRAYALAGLLMLGPLGKPAARALYRLRRPGRDRQVAE